MRSETELDAGDCRTLLERGVVGRIAFWAEDGPRIHPVNYSVLDDAVLVRTLPTSALARVAQESPGAPVAFEVDGLDHADQRGWSVQARGPVERLTDPEAVVELERVRPPRTWAPGERTVVVRLCWTELTGRCLGTGWDPVRDQDYRRLR
ncbi:pyridoxamine 5'-phosphate oxidase family protein [Nocardioides sp. SOB77]|uniref:Pyridoxamine 5'-phosphate oxidase family protein n=1 Tax=Nocardioides oceani TaxID=3058369 RepID=A0ABT8FL28_9ACTN|nr:pyridoxamine 5'-phosphate oxidase family protein [Nocardioides oceani]MDN4175386.1 pyridoxamine 5'-phosphate oxidase family protein [Nocardioides oceani]